jgi:hypothetical protein
LHPKLASLAGVLSAINFGGEPVLTFLKNVWVCSGPGFIINFQASHGQVLEENKKEGKDEK